MRGSRIEVGTSKSSRKRREKKQSKKNTHQHISGDFASLHSPHNSLAALVHLYVLRAGGVKVEPLAEDKLYVERFECFEDCVVIISIYSLHEKIRIRTFAMQVVIEPGEQTMARMQERDFFLGIKRFDIRRELYIANQSASATML